MAAIAQLSMMLYTGLATGMRFSTWDANALLRCEGDDAMLRRRSITVALLMGLGVLVAGCATTGVGSASPPTPTSFTVTATPQPTPTAVTDIASPTTIASPQRCGPSAGAFFMGDLAISKPEVLYGFNADFMLPDGLSTAHPLTVTTQNNGAFVLGGALQSRAVVQPVEFLVDICNTSTSSTHHLGDFGVRLTSLTPYAGQLNVLNGCASLYARSGSIGGECASGYSPDIEESFQFAANATAPATVSQTLSLAAPILPGEDVGIGFSVHPPTSVATMTFQLGVGIDGQAISYPAALTTQPAINAPIARRWAGNYCSVASMQSQIPATSPANTFYVCPQV